MTQGAQGETVNEERRLLLVPLLQPRPAADDTLSAGVAAWALRVNEAQETALLLNDRGRVIAISTGAALVLGLDPTGCLGRPLLELIVLVDFSASGLPVEDPEVQLPPLKALRSRSMARGLVRLRLGAGVLVTYDCVGVPLAGGDGALAFFAEV
ncbi:MAG TPA: hypothetical protein VMZ11_02720 [Mycobacteriales bacterium]|nr:hypothetical protein [Mycobacteriales bacterium]